MADYYFEDVDLTMTDPTVIEDGACGGHFVNGVSGGGFYCDIKVTTPQASHKFRLEAPATQPVEFTTEEINIWVLAELDAQYLVP